MPTTAAVNAYGWMDAGTAICFFNGDLEGERVELALDSWLGFFFNDQHRHIISLHWIILVAQTSISVCLPVSHTYTFSHSFTYTHRARQVAEVDALLQRVEAIGQQRLAEPGGYVPRVLRLAERYALSAAETALITALLIDARPSTPTMRHYLALMASHSQPEKVQQRAKYRVGNSRKNLTPRD